MNYNVEDLKKRLIHNPVNYRTILAHKENFLKKEEVDVSIVVGTKDREKHLKKCLEYINYAKQQCGLKIGVVVVQHDKHPSSRLLAIEADASYVYIPVENYNTENLYSPALSYNTGYFASPDSQYFMFHGCDVLFPHDYFTVYEKEYFSKKPKWLQNFFGKSLYYLDKEQTDKVFNLRGIFNLYNMPNVEKGYPGAPGGSISVSKETFLEVGGFDPELFFGWAAEDSFFWTKLLCTVRRVDAIRACHVFENEINFCYPINPPLRQYHMFHESTPNAKWGEMQEIHDSFWGFSHEDKMNYIEFKKKLFTL